MLILLSWSCTPESPPPVDPVPPCVDAVVTDIDETLTTLDDEFLMQLGDPTHDPAERPDASTLMAGYADRGFRIAYVTARGELLTLTDARPAQLATEQWLDEHGFPRQDGDVYLAPDALLTTGQASVDYKAETIEGLVDAGWTFQWAYGNATTDIEAFQQAGIPDERIFVVGELAGDLPGNGLTDDEAFTEHLAHLDTVETSCPPPSE